MTVEAQQRSVGQGRTAEAEQAIRSKRDCPKVGTDQLNIADFRADVLNEPLRFAV